MNDNDNTHSPPGWPPFPWLPEMNWGEEDYDELLMVIAVFEGSIQILNRDPANGSITPILTSPAHIARALAQVTAPPVIFDGPDVLFYEYTASHHHHIGVYLPPQVWSLRLKLTSEPAQTLEVPLPGLVLSGVRQEYRLWAVKDAPYGRKDIPLFWAPMPNVGRPTKNGPIRVCAGDLPLPEASGDTMGQVLEMLFERSIFNKDYVQGKCKTHPTNVTDLWVELDLDQDAVDFPPDELMPAGITLWDLIKEVSE